MRTLAHKTCAVGAVSPGLRPGTNASVHARPFSAARLPCSRPAQRVSLGSSGERNRLVAKVAEASSPAEAADVSVSIDNQEDPDSSVSMPGRFGVAPVAKGTCKTRNTAVTCSCFQYS